MRKLSVNTFVSLDGVMQAPGGPEEDPSAGFTHGGWSVNYWDETMTSAMDEYMGKPFELLLGRKTYEIFAAHWPRVSDDPAADALNAAPKHVASRTLDKTEWQNSTLIQGDVAAYVSAFKEQPGPEIQVHGSGTIPAGLKVVDSKVSSTGVVISTYERAGAIEYGSFAL